MRRFVLRSALASALVCAVGSAGWQLQHEPWDARLVLETARAAGHPDAAGPVLAWLEETGFEDPRLQRMAAELTLAQSCRKVLLVRASMSTEHTILTFITLRLTQWTKSMRASSRFWRTMPPEPA